jgi:hypothetical protein
MCEACAVRQTVGTTPVSKDLLKMRHNIGEILGASSFFNFWFLVHLDLLLLPMMNQGLIVIMHKRNKRRLN